METEILKLWTDMNAFQTSLEFSRGRPEYNFYDGPPFATGTPHYGHLLAGTIKDVVTRFAHQTGHHVERRFGWDTHGVPVEFEIDKKLGISGSADVEKMGIAKYNEECRSIVMRYADEWRYTVNRLGRWIDFDNDYKTLYPWFMESVWWVFKQIFDKDMVYRGFKVMPFSTALSTPLSNFEANQDMHDVDDPAVTVSFKLVDEDAAFLAWTTTPWTLPSNLALCVHPTLDYVKFRDTKRERVYIALKSRLFGKGCLYKEGDKSVEIIEEFKGETLRGRRYEPLFPYFKRLEDRAFKVLVDTYVTDDSGTGIVHNAPGHGEDDYRVCLAAGVVTATDIPCPLDDCGKYTDEVSDYKGMYIKDADNVIIKRLKDEGKMFQAGRVKHAYAHCWRSGTPLVRKTVDSWFIRVEDIKDKLVQNNQNTYWVPQNIRDGRFHNWLADARDWAFSRNRFWGTPIPIWVSEDYEEVVCIGSIEELKELSGRTDIEDLHREHLDDITIPSKQGKGVLRRVPQVFDCWFESGSMPYAQVHYPFENKERFEKNFPADFIAEGVDQTRGWFYTLMVISTLLFDQPPWKNLIVNGLVLAGDGKKMSKRLKNYPDPNLVLEEDGADALRLYLITSPAVRAENLRFERKGVQALIKDVFLPWLNAFRFFEQQAERWKQAVGRPFTFDSAKACPSTNKMDKWILAFTQDLIRFVKQEMAAYRLYTVVPKLLSFVDNLTNWFIRFNRKRLKGANSDDDAALALWALGEVLMTMSVTMGPFTPFFAEWMYQHMRPFVVTASASTTTRGHKVSTSSDIALTLHQGPMTAAAEAVAEWSLDNVNAWLSSNELEDYQELFASNGLTGADLVDLSHDDLLSMGVNRCTDRKRILRAARKLMQGSAPPSPRRVATPAAASGSDNVRTINGVREDASVHFQLIPEPKSVYLDETIVRAFEAMKRVVEAGRIVRERENIPIKYPLQELVIVSKTPFLLDDIRHLEEYILSELNVQRITLSADESPYNVTLKGQPDSRNLGVRFKNDYKAIHKAVIGLSHEALQGYQTNGSIEVCGHTLSGTDISLRYEFAAGTESKYRAQTDNDILVLLNVEQNRDMLEEGYARELVNRVQKLRKQGNITPTDTIRVFFRMIQDDTEVQLAEVIKNRAAFITESVGFKLEEGAPEGLTVSVEGEQTIKNAKFQLAIVKL
ncbi:uncharacterized protein MONBRDRAFT_19043 [Monosiga brevicollis MX1]|uniref:isoleucine--tRNA ligase n=1 Tax=Monosiga brevicollis TaxID=81824 RepID=A9UP01_MONBE|nr:uncharacterized protein MONBRDRAFT_19043 [Monosiga brevicollis MX1]EDQ92788.1 predicted protein [Monosiga brevicollis MX1]|eukprot:XP_001742550.1 hypothetical protein [Monosiga brevicollis MX1]